MSGASASDGPVIAALRQTGIPFERIDIDPEYADTAAFCARYGYPLSISANTIVVATKRGEKAYSANVILATTRLDVNRRVRDLMEASKLSFASADETQALTGMEIGGVTAFGLPDGIPLYVDHRVLLCDEVILGAGSRTWKILAPPDILRVVPGFEEVRDLAKPVEPNQQSLTQRN